MRSFLQVNTTAQNENRWFIAAVVTDGRIEIAQRVIELIAHVVNGRAIEMRTPVVATRGYGARVVRHGEIELPVVMIGAAGCPL